MATGKPAGRPKIFKHEIALEICKQISISSKSLRTICAAENMPCVGTVLTWLNEDTHGFLAQYERAKQNQAELMAEEMIDIADDGSNDFMTITGKGGKDYEVENKEVTSRSRLRVDTRKWLLSKLKPKKYGDKVQQEISGPNGKEFEITLKL